MWHDMYVKAKTKSVKPQDGSYRIADMICDALEKLPVEEQGARIKAISKIKITDRRNISKQESTPSSRAQSRQHGEP
jgi:hypothetical protein